MNACIKVLVWSGAIYFAIDTWILGAFWMVKESLVAWRILWFQVPLTGIVFFRQNYEFVSSLPGFEPKQFYIALALGPTMLIILLVVPLILFIKAQSVNL